MVNPFIKSSFGALLELHEVRYNSVDLSLHPFILEQTSPGVKNKLESVMARLDMLSSEEDGEDAIWYENEQERRARLFK